MSTRGLWAAFGLAALLAMPVGATEYSTVLAGPRQRIQGADFRASGHLIRVEASGKRTSYGIAIKAHWFPGVLRVLAEITPPTKASSDTPARARILMEMRPKGQNTVLIAHPGDKSAAVLPFEKWSDGPLGSGLTYEDILEPQYFWPEQTVAEKAKYGARICDLITSKPGPADRTHYAQIQTWLDQDIGFPVYVEKTLKGTGAVKQFTYFGIRHEAGVWSAHQVEVKTRGQAGSTLLIFDRGTPRANLGVKDFSPEQLLHFQDHQ